MNYSWVILKHFDLYQQTVLQPIKSNNFFFLKEVISYQIDMIRVYKQVAIINGLSTINATWFIQIISLIIC